MASLWDKINVLVRSHVDRFLTEGLGLGQGHSASDLAAAARLGQNVEREIAALRKQVNDALEREDAMEAQIAQIRQEMAALDAQADQALAGGDEAAARHFISQIKTLDRQAALLEADLNEHRRSTAAFIDQVNEIEALVAEAQRRAAAEQSAAPQPAAPSPAQQTPVPPPPARLTTSPPPESQASTAPSPQKATTVKVKVQTGRQPDIQAATPPEAAARPAEQPAAPSAKAAEPPAAPPEAVRVTTSTTAVETLDSILATARREIETLAAEEQRLAVQPPAPEKPAGVNPEVRTEYEAEVEQAQVEDDLAVRRARLTRRLSGQE